MPDNATPNTAVATRDNSDVGQFQRQLESRARDIQMALPGHITPDKFQRTVLTAVAQNPDLLRADRPSLILACYKAAQDALLPDGREAALVTFNTRFKDPGDGQWKSKKLVQYMPMVYGLRKKILQSAEVVSLEVNVIYRAEVDKGTFLYEVGLEPPLRHRPSLDLTEAETTDDQIIGAYSIATMKDGTKSYEIMRRFEIDKVRQVSQTGATGRTDRQGKPIEPKGPWVDWFAEMAKKTVMRRHAKTLPMSGDVLIDIEGRELERGVSTAAALGSTAPDAPTAIEDQTDDGARSLVVDEHGDSYDANTGEHVPDEQLTPEERGISAEEAAQRDAKPESGAKPTRAGKATPAKAQAQPKEEAAVVEQEPARDEQTGITKDPFEEKGDEYVERLSKAETIIDLDAVHAEFERESEGWPYEIVQGVEAEHKRHTRRLSPAKADLETAGAK